MAKLLDMKGNDLPVIYKEKEDKTVTGIKSDLVDTPIQDAIEEDVWMGLTPDLAALRYKGPQLVFLWDNTRYTEWFEDEDLEKGVDYQVNFWNAQTKYQYLPITNGNVTKSNYPYYLHKTANWMDRVETTAVQKIVTKEPAPVGGRIYTVGIKAISALDEHYGNGFTHQRRLVPVRSIKSVENSVKECWVYFANYEAFGKYDPHEKKFMSTHGIDFQPTRFVNGNYELAGQYSNQQVVG